MISPLGGTIEKSGKREMSGSFSILSSLSSHHNGSTPKRREQVGRGPPTLVIDDDDDDDDGLFYVVQPHANRPESSYSSSPKLQRQSSPQSDGDDESVIEYQVKRSLPQQNDSQSLEDDGDDGSQEGLTRLEKNRTQSPIYWESLLTGAPKKQKAILRPHLDGRDLMEHVNAKTTVTDMISMLVQYEIAREDRETMNGKVAASGLQGTSSTKGKSSTKGTPSSMGSTNTTSTPEKPRKKRKQSTQATLGMMSTPGAGQKDQIYVDFVGAPEGSAQTEAQWNDWLASVKKPRMVLIEILKKRRLLYKLKDSVPELVKILVSKKDVPLCSGRQKIMAELVGVKRKRERLCEMLNERGIPLPQKASFQQLVGLIAKDDEEISSGVEEDDEYDQKKDTDGDEGDSEQISEQDGDDGDNGGNGGNDGNGDDESDDDGDEGVDGDGGNGGEDSDDGDDGSAVKSRNQSTISHMEAARQVLLDEWFENNCTFRPQFEAAFTCPVVSRQRQVSRKRRRDTMINSWLVWEGIDQNLVTWYGHPSLEPIWNPLRGGPTDFMTDMIAIVEFLAKDEKNPDKGYGFIWFHLLAKHYASKKKLPAPRFRNSVDFSAAATLLELSNVDIDMSYHIIRRRLNDGIQDDFFRYICENGGGNREIMFPFGFGYDKIRVWPQPDQKYLSKFLASACKSMNEHDKWSSRQKEEMADYICSGWNLQLQFMKHLLEEIKRNFNVSFSNSDDVTASWSWIRRRGPDFWHQDGVEDYSCFLYFPDPDKTSEAMNGIISVEPTQLSRSSDGSDLLDVGNVNCGDALIIQNRKIYHSAPTSYLQTTHRGSLFRVCFQIRKRSIFIDGATGQNAKRINGLYQVYDEAVGQGREVIAYRRIPDEGEEEGSDVFLEYHESRWQVKTEHNRGKKAGMITGSLCDSFCEPFGVDQMHYWKQFEKEAWQKVNLKVGKVLADVDATTMSNLDLASVKDSVGLLSTPPWKLVQDISDEESEGEILEGGNITRSVRRSERINDRRKDVGNHSYNKRALTDALKSWNWLKTKLVSTLRDGNCLYQTLWKCLNRIRFTKLGVVEEFGKKILRWFVEVYFPRICKLCTSPTSALGNAMFESMDDEATEGIDADAIKAGFIISFVLHIDINILQLRRSRKHAEESGSSWLGILHKFRFDEAKWIEELEKNQLNPLTVAWDPSIMSILGGAEGALCFVKQEEAIWDNNVQNDDSNTILEAFIEHTEARGRNPKISFAFYHVGDRQHFDVLSNDVKPSIFHHNGGVDGYGNVKRVEVLMDDIIALYAEVTKGVTKKKRSDGAAKESRKSSRVS